MQSGEFERDLFMLNASHTLTLTSSAKVGQGLTFLLTTLKYCRKNPEYLMYLLINDRLRAVTRNQPYINKAHPIFSTTDSWFTGLRTKRTWGQIWASGKNFANRLTCNFRYQTRKDESGS